MVKKRIIGGALLLFVSLYPCVFLAANIHWLLSGTQGMQIGPATLIAGMVQEEKIRMFFLLFLLMAVALTGWAMLSAASRGYKSGVRHITPDITTPLPAGEGQHGTAEWLSPKEFKRAFSIAKLQPQHDTMRRLADCGLQDKMGQDIDAVEMKTAYKGELIPEGGVAVGQTENGKTLYMVTEDTHSLTLGATRSAKTRNVVLPSICVTALAGESMVIVDVKGEIFLYTREFLERLGYEVIDIDFENPAKSRKNNFMQLVNDKLDAGDIPGAKAACLDVVEGLTGRDNSKTGERIWTEGEKSILACCIMAVSCGEWDHTQRSEAREKAQTRNLCNVYYFIANMCAPVGGDAQVPLQAYLDVKPDGHPAKALAGISNVAHFRTRSSFYAAALATLRLFEDDNIADMTSITDYDIYATGKKKRAIFIILPDEKPAYYAVGSMYVYQQYQVLVSEAKKRGGRLERRVEFFMDEVGNFAYIPWLDKLLTVGGGRGIRFHLFLQDTKQLDETYGNNISSIVRSNCETWIYMQSDDVGTLREISEKLGNYTTKSANLSTNLDGMNGSAGFGYMSRPLLTPEEVKKVRRPWQLVMTRQDPVVLYAPDIGKTIFNDMLGMGSKKENIDLSIRRQNRRQTRTIGPPELWTVWTRYRKPMEDQAEEVGKIQERTNVPEQPMPVHIRDNQYSILEE